MTLRPLRPVLLGVLLLASAAQAQQPRDPLDLPSGSEAPALSRAALDAATPARHVCREMVRLVNTQGEIWQLVREGQRDRTQLRADQRQVAQDWRSTRSRCDLAIIELERGWPRDVMDHEVQLVTALQTALGAVVKTYLASTDADLAAVNGRIAEYSAALALWTDWLERSSDFWSGVYLEEAREASCSADLRESARRFAKGLWRQTTVDPAVPAEEAMTTLQATLAALKREHGRCAGELEGDRARVEHRLSGELLAAYGDCLVGLEARDDDVVRAAMDTEQFLVSRLQRCRDEFDAGKPSADCQP